jgi:hypothetical protein
LRHLKEGTVQAMEKSLSAFGQAHLAGQALEQRRAQPGFKRTDLMGNRRRCHGQLFGGGLETQQA